MYAGIEYKAGSTEADQLRAFLTERGITNPKLTVLVKIDREGRYEQMVDLSDELNQSKIQRFSLAPLVEADRALMAKVKV